MELSLAATMVNKAFDNDLVDGHAIKAFRRVKRKLKPGSNARTRIVSISEYLKLTAIAPPHLKAIIKTALNTGMRLGEILTLRWQHVDKEYSFLRLPYGFSKEKKPKNIPINSHLEDLLKSTPRAFNHDFVFTYKSKPIAECGIKRSFRTACIKAKLPYGRKCLNGITFHDIRRTVKTNMLSAGVDKAHRDTILGHTLKGMDVHYLKPSEDSLRKAIQVYTEWLDDKTAEAEKVLTKPLTKNGNSLQQDAVSY
jgi:integrase